MYAPMPKIVVDSREQLPYDFNHVVVKCLHTGDYSLEGLEVEVAIERKSLPDCYGSLGGGRKRFKEEWERMAEMNFAAVVVEASLVEFLGQSESKMNPKAAINSLISWQVRYGVPVWFACSRTLAKGLVYNALRHYWINLGRPEIKEGRQAKRPPLLIQGLGDGHPKHSAPQGDAKYDREDNTTLKSTCQLSF